MQPRSAFVRRVSPEFTDEARLTRDRSRWGCAATYIGNERLCQAVDDSRRCVTYRGRSPLGIIRSFAVLSWVASHWASNAPIYQDILPWPSVCRRLSGSSIELFTKPFHGPVVSHFSPK